MKGIAKTRLCLWTHLITLLGILKVYISWSSLQMYGSHVPSFSSMQWRWKLSGNSWLGHEHPCGRFHAPLFPSHGKPEAMHGEGGIQNGEGLYSWVTAWRRGMQECCCPGTFPLDFVCMRKKSFLCWNLSVATEDNQSWYNILTLLE